MMRLPCPYCGTRDEIEFRFGGESHIERPDVNVSDADWAIGLAQSLFSSKVRLGQISPEGMTERQLRFIRKLANMDVIFYKGSGGGHDYFESPEVKSDIAMLGEGRQAGAEHGRPLEPIGPHLWYIRDGYRPGP